VFSLQRLRTIFLSRNNQQILTSCWIYISLSYHSCVCFMFYLSVCISECTFIWMLVAQQRLSREILRLNLFWKFNMLRFLVCKYVYIYIWFLQFAICKMYNDLQISLSIGVYAGIYIAQNYEVCHTFNKIKSCFYNWLIIFNTMELQFIMSVLSFSCVQYKILDTTSSTLLFLEANLFSFYRFHV